MSLCLKCDNYQVMPHFWTEGEVVHPDSLEHKCILDMFPIDAYVDTPGGIPSVVGAYCKAFLDRKLAGSRKRGG